METAGNKPKRGAGTTIAVAAIIFVLGAFLSWMVATRPWVRAALAQQGHKVALQFGLAEDTEPVPPPVAKAARKPTRPQAPPKPVATATATATATAPAPAKPAIEAEAVVGNRRLPLRSNGNHVVVVGTQQPGAPAPGAVTIHQ